LGAAEIEVELHIVVVHDIKQCGESSAYPANHSSKGANHTRPRGDQSLALGIVARPPNKRADCLFDLRAGGARNAPGWFCR
jgi:hypothetical protein